jgi:hypothetical protein
MDKEEFTNIVSTLVTNGFQILNVERFSQDNLIINTYKFDKLGAKILYSLLFSKNTHESPSLNQLLTISKTLNSNPILISDFIKSKICVSFTYKKFYDFFGGIIYTGLILIPNLPEILDQLGHKTLPDGLTGRPEHLYEIYVVECLQFIMGSPARKYGQDRLFEKLPDGVVICKNNFLLLIDSKAYSKGFKFKADDIKRFASYVIDFNQRYSSYFGNVFSFLVISGHFVDSKESIENRSVELYKACNCNLTCITSKVLGNIVQMLSCKPEIRTSIIWKNVFSECIIETKLVEKEISSIIKHKLY